MRTDWVSAVRALGGAEEVARAVAEEPAVRYAEPHRRHHDTAHVLAVLRDSAALAADLRLPPENRAALTLAATAHDVVYDGQPGEDERRSAEWAASWLRRAGVSEDHVSRVEELVLATLTHTAPDGDPTAPADLLARDPLYAKAAGRTRWETAAKANLARELSSLSGTR